MRLHHELLREKPGQTLNKRPRLFPLHKLNMKLCQILAVVSCFAFFKFHFKQVYDTSRPHTTSVPTTVVQPSLAFSLCLSTFVHLKHTKETSRPHCGLFKLPNIHQRLNKYSILIQFVRPLVVDLYRFKTRKEVSG